MFGRSHCWGWCDMFSGRKGSGIDLREILSSGGRGVTMIINNNKLLYEESS